MQGDRKKWGRDWGVAYDENFKREKIPKILAPFKSEIGPVVLDVGSGKHPVSEYLGDGRKIITVDYGGSIPSGEHDTSARDDNDTVERAISRQHINFNIDNLGQRTKAMRGALSKGARFLGLDPRNAPKEQVDTVFFSDVLNYVDYREVLAEGARYLKPGGLLIIINRPNRGEIARFHPKRLKDNFDLYTFLESDAMNFKIECKKPISKKYESEINIPEPENDWFIVLVARKKTEVE